MTTFIKKHADTLLALTASYYALLCLPLLVLLFRIWILTLFEVELTNLIIWLSIPVLIIVVAAVNVVAVWPLSNFVIGLRLKYGKKIYALLVFLIIIHTICAVALSYLSLQPKYSSGLISVAWLANIVAIATYLGVCAFMPAKLKLAAFVRIWLKNTQSSNSKRILLVVALAFSTLCTGLLPIIYMFMMSKEIAATNDVAIYHPSIILGWVAVFFVVLIMQIYITMPGVFIVDWLRRKLGSFVYYIQILITLLVSVGSFSLLLIFFSEGAGNSPISFWIMQVASWQMGISAFIIGYRGLPKLTSLMQTQRATN